MPPKKEVEVEVLLGRPGNNVTIGLVGLPNVGKSSLFNLLCGLNVMAENYPFCTIDPNTAVVPVPDERFDDLVESWQPKSTIPAVLSVTDIAGLVKGAAEGKGLGNAFLSNIQAVDGIYHVTRAFKDKKIEHVEGDVDPTRDFEIIKAELIAKDIARMEDVISKLEKSMRNKKIKQLEDDLKVAEKCMAWLKDKREVRHGEWNGKEVIYLNTLQLLTAKPAVYLVNISALNFETQKNAFMKDVLKWVKANSPGSPVIPFSVTWEQKFVEKTPEEQKEYLKDKKYFSMLPRIIQSGYKAMHLINFFTTGQDEVRSWTIKKNSKAPSAAGVIHGDLEKGFKHAEVYNYDAFKEHKVESKLTGKSTEDAVQKAGKKRQQGKEYVVQNGDICFFVSTMGRGKKK